MAATLSTEPPAIAGGHPVKKGPYGKSPRYGEEELKELKEALDQQTLFYAQGHKVKEMEKAFAAITESKFAIACTSGTAAIHSAMIAAGVSPGDEVIVAPITDMGSIVPILFQGAIPVFADLDPHTYNMTADTVKAVATPATRAILAVHLAGNAIDMTPLRELADQHNLILIEDCAQSHGCRYQGKPVGNFSHYGCYSFNEFKHIACGDGGVIITDDETRAAKIRMATDKAYSRVPGAPRFPAFLANNYRMTELQGAVALAQIRKLPSIVERRRKWCGALRERLQSLQGITQPGITPGCDPSWWFYMMRVNEKELGADTDKFTAALKAEGLPVGAHYIGNCIYEYPIFTQHSGFERGNAGHAYSKREYRKGLCPVAEEILKTCVMLSINEAYTGADLDQTATAIERVVAWFRSKR
jgi:perosamine synthetase